MIRLYEGADGCFGLASSLTPGEAAAHAWDFEVADLHELPHESLMAVARVRPLRIRSERRTEPGKGAGR